MAIGFIADSWRLARRRPPASRLADSGMNFLELELARVRYLDTGGNGPTVVIAPDPPNTIEHHLAMVEELRKTHRVIVFDMPGFGFSYPRRRFQFTLDQQRAGLVEFLEALEVRDATLLFSCLASYLALEVAARHPNLVNAIVLAQAPSFSDGVDWARRMDSRGLLGTPILGQLMMAAKGVRVAEGWYRAALPKGADIADFFEPAQAMLHDRGCYCLASGFQAFPAYALSDYSGIGQPVTAFWGALDRTHRPSNPEGIRDHVRHADVRVLKDCGHFPDLEYTTDVIAAIRE